MAATCHQRRPSVNAKTGSRCRAFHRALPAWYRRHCRDLPWRRTRDPYRIWVSEVMLQQTRVDVVRDYYRRWLRAFPTLRALARAPFPRVLKLWEGLGYYQRARHLHAAARQLARRPGRSLPRTFASWRALPGIGPYTAAAIASIAFGE
ncbi:A/G-specific adenine glycosylase, partial [bacterium]|nr:A/G-specific adenine glycosylase [bacterium]